MIHFGDITKLNGADLPAVDIVTGGSPCQDLSIAGRRAGLAGERSGLFMDQIRIIKEMREHARLRRTDDNFRVFGPRFMVWENVCGAQTSNGGDDFRAVLEETARIVCEDAVIPQPPEGIWSSSGCILGDGWNVAWRVHDAQFWGVPQRRKRIALVADFGGESATEILFEPESMRRDFETSEKEGKETSSETSRSTAFSSNSFGGWVEEDISASIRASGGDYGGGSETLVVDDRGLRRKTPLETERLFGYPDGWTDIGPWTDTNGRVHPCTDACRYRALGNSIALPFWEWMAQRMVNVLKREGIERPKAGIASLNRKMDAIMITIVSIVIGPSAR